MAIFIVLRHAVNVDTYGLTSGVLYCLECFVWEATDIIVPTFFALSGYLFFQDLEWKRLPYKLKSRFYSLVVPYITWCVISFLFYCIICLIPVVRINMNQGIAFFSLENLCGSILNHTYNGPLWFLKYLIEYMALTPLLFAVLENPIKRALPKVYIILLIVVLLIAVVLVRNKFLSYFMAFIFGAIVGRYYKGIVQDEYKETTRVIAAIVLLITTLLGMKVDFERFYMLVRILQVIAVWIAGDVLRIDKEPEDWMKISFVIFCSHTLILEPIEKVFLIAFGNKLMGAWLDFAFAPLITIAIIYGLSYICRKIPGLWKIINGGR